jgi:hypothetical protein
MPVVIGVPGTTEASTRLGRSNRGKEGIMSDPFATASKQTLKVRINNMINALLTLD